MSERIKAIFEDGVLKPVVPIEAKNGDVFEFVRIDTAPMANLPRNPAEILAEIAEQFKDSDLPTDLSTNHDYYLYGGKKKDE